MFVESTNKVIGISASGDALIIEFLFVESFSYKINVILIRVYFE